MMNKMMKKVAIVIAAAAMATASMSAVAMANDGMGIDEVTPNVSVQEMNAVKFVVAEHGANVRTAPSTEGRIIKSLDYNTQINITGKTSNGWYQIMTTDPTFGGETAGYIAGDLLSDNKGAEIVTPANNGVNAKYTWIKETNSAHSSQVKEQRGQMSHDNDTFTVSVQSGYLALRSSAVTDPSNEIAHLQNGTMVQVKQYGSQFDYVYIPSIDAYGYVNNDYLAG